MKYSSTIHFLVFSNLTWTSITSSARRWVKWMKNNFCRKVWAETLPPFDLYSCMFAGMIVLKISDTAYQSWSVSRSFRNLGKFGFLEIFDADYNLLFHNLIETFGYYNMSPSHLFFEKKLTSSASTKSFFLNYVNVMIATDVQRAYFQLSTGVKSINTAT